VEIFRHFFKILKSKNGGPFEKCDVILAWQVIATKMNAKEDKKEKKRSTWLKFKMFVQKFQSENLNNSYSLKSLLSNISWKIIEEMSCAKVFLH